MKVSLLLVLWWVPTPIAAWVTPLSRSRVSRTRFFATVEDSATTTTTTMAVQKTLTEDSLKAAELAHAQLQQMIPSDYQPTFLPLLNHFVVEYIKAAQDAKNAGNDPTINDPHVAAKRILTAISYGLQYGMADKYQFDVSHTALRGNPETENGNTIDFYAFGCDFFRSAMDLKHSIVAGRDNLKRAMEQVQRGENVVLFANHQSEADPQVVSCCLELAGYAKAAADVVYVAGHKVTTDPLAVPFSMGRNLICIHSKKHINADPSTKPAKQKQNLRSMKAMLDKFKEGGCLLWVAPSGGRDRRNVETGEVPIAPFDSKTIDIFRLYGNKSKVPTHYYSLAMVTYDLCPPPDFVEAGVGEKRNVRFVPVAVAVGNELESVGGLEGRHEFCEAAQNQCEQDYQMLLEELAKLKKQ